MTTQDETLHLSAWQHQAIADLGLNAWYLTPLKRTETADDRAHNALIDTLVGSLDSPPDADAAVSRTPPRSNEVANTDVASTHTSTSEDTVFAKTNEMTTRPVGDIMQSATTATPMPSATPPDKDRAVGTAGKPMRRVIQPPSPIKLPQKQHNYSTPPLDNKDNKGSDSLNGEDLAFPEQPHCLSWETLQAEAIALAQKGQQPCFWGQQNNLNANELFVFPPPDRQREQHPPDNDAVDGTPPQPQTVNEPAIHEPISNGREQQLLTEMLASIGVDWQAGYSTRLLKHATRYGQDPDTTELSTHLSLLASELALTKPRRIWLFGALACRSITQSSAPLSALMDRHYALHYTGGDGETVTAQLLCLPSVDYLLALPSEKGKVWTLLKKLK